MLWPKTDEIAKLRFRKKGRANKEVVVYSTFGRVIMIFINRVLVTKWT